MERARNKLSNDRRRNSCVAVIILITWGVIVGLGVSQRSHGELVPGERLPAALFFPGEIRVADKINRLSMSTIAIAASRTAFDSTVKLIPQPLIEVPAVDDRSPENARQWHKAVSDLRRVEAAYGSPTFMGAAQLPWDPVAAATSPVAHVGVIVVAMSNASLQQACEHVEEHLASLLEPPSAIEPRLLTLLVIAGPKELNWPACRSLEAASFAVVFEQPSVPTYAAATQSAAARFHGVASHVLVVEATRVATVLTAAHLRRLQRIECTECQVFSCSEYDSAGVINSGGLEPIVSIDGALRRYTVTTYGGFLLSSMIGSFVTAGTEQTRVWHHSGRYESALVNPLCMLLANETIALIAGTGTPRLNPRWADAANALQHLDVAASGKVLATALEGLESQLLRVSVLQVTRDVALAEKFDSILTLAAEWATEAADTLSSRSPLSRFESFTARSPDSSASPAAVLNSVVARTVDVAQVVTAVWMSQRSAAAAPSAATPLSDSLVELALTVSAAASGGRSRLHPALSFPANTSAADAIRVSPFLAMRARRHFAALRSPLHLTVAWFHQCCHCCGFSNELVHLAVPLQRHLPLMLMASPECFCDGFDRYATAVIRATSTESRQYLAHRDPAEPIVWISHTTPLLYAHPLLACNPPSYFVGRSMFEFSHVPQVWISKLMIADEIWVPSQFVLEAFAARFVDRSKLVVVPEAIDTDLFTPARHQRFVLPHFSASRLMNDSSNLASNRPLGDPFSSPEAANLCRPVNAESNQRAREEDPQRSSRPPEAHHFKFLSAFKWELRKGWDTLVRAFARAFKPHERVSLYVSTSIFWTEMRGYRHNRDAEAILGWMINATERIGIAREALPHIVVITAEMNETEVASLYRSADAFVLPTRGEGWGLTAMQAMASGLATIATNCSGLLDFMTPGTAYPIRVLGTEPIPVDRVGVLDVDETMRWAVVDESHLVALLQHVAYHPEEAREVGQRAHRHISERYSEDAVFRQHVEPNLRRIHDLIASRPPRSRSVDGSVNCW
jgi:glycosyltransferase involved in cell wall biosynthesis